MNGRYVSGNTVIITGKGWLCSKEVKKPLRLSKTCRRIRSGRGT